MYTEKFKRLNFQLFISLCEIKKIITAALKQKSTVLMRTFMDFCDPELSTIAKDEWTCTFFITILYFIAVSSYLTRNVCHFKLCS